MIMIPLNRRPFVVLAQGGSPPQRVLFAGVGPRGSHDAPPRDLHGSRHYTPRVRWGCQGRDLASENERSIDFRTLVSIVLAGHQIASASVCGKQVADLGEERGLGMDPEGSRVKGSGGLSSASILTVLAGVPTF